MESPPIRWEAYKKWLIKAPPLSGLELICRADFKGVLHRIHRPVQWQSLDTQVDLLIQLLQALAYLHRRGVLHRDLKPGNVLVVNGQVKVLDFGLSLITERSVADVTQSTTGTFAYMAPELFQGMPPSTRSDLYVVGVLAYEILAGQHPFSTDNVALLISQILTAPVDMGLLNVDDELIVVISRLLDRTADERYKDANDTIKTLCAATGKNLPKETASIRESFLQAAKFVGRDNPNRASNWPNLRVALSSTIRATPPPSSPGIGMPSRKTIHQHSFRLSSGTDASSRSASASVRDSKAKSLNLSILTTSLAAHRQNRQSPA